MKKVIFTFLLVLTAATRLWADVYTVQSVPDPKRYCADCWVSNPDGIIAPEVENDINQIASYVNQTVGAEIAVVAIEAFDEAKYGDVFNFAQSLFNTWGIGGSENNSGLLLVFAYQTRDIRIQTGDGLEGLLPDIKCGDIIDENIEWFTNGEYGAGLRAIVISIADELVTDEAQAELLLGYKPKSVENIQKTMWYFFAAVLICVLVYFWAYKRWNDKKNKSRKQLFENTNGVQTAAGCLTLFFPLPMFFLWLYLRKKHEKIRTQPEPCKKCGHQMQLVPAADASAYLTEPQQTEVKLQSAEYDVWHCPECGNVDVISYSGKFEHQYQRCPKCNALASKYISLDVIEIATYTSTGLINVHYKCACCGAVFDLKKVTPKVSRSSSYSSSDSSRSSSSSSSSGGSWGGGHSSGGGAGRKF